MSGGVFSYVYRSHFTISYHLFAYACSLSHIRRRNFYGFVKSVNESDQEFVCVLRFHFVPDYVPPFALSGLHFFSRFTAWLSCEHNAFLQR